MPLDGHAFLLNQGWSGAGTGLRKGAISRPIAIPQKRTQAGIGNDRDDAFPFWDHLFAVAASAIQIDCFSSDDEDRTPSVTRDTTLELRQTSTGILSNRPPLVGTPVSSGATTPTPSSTPRLSLLALAKRETARRGLYSKFFRGPTLGPADVQSEMVKTATLPSDDDAHESRKRKRKKTDVPTEDPDREERRRRKRLRREAERAARKLERHEEKKNPAKDGDGDDAARSGPVDETVLLSASREEASGPLVSTAPDEAPQGKRKRNGSRSYPVENGLHSQTPVSVDERTLDGRNGSSKSSRKRRRPDRYP